MPKAEYYGKKCVWISNELFQLLRLVAGKQGIGRFVEAAIRAATRELPVGQLSFFDNKKEYDNYWH